MTLWLSKIYAHNSKEAHYEILEIQNGISVRAEFPWTIRKALFEYKPELASNKSKEVMDIALHDYVNANFIIKNAEGKILRLMSVIEVNDGGHSHQVNYRFLFDEGKPMEIINTLMFNISDAHTNFHHMKAHGYDLNFNTSPRNSSFQLNKGNSMDINWYWYTLPFLIIGILILYTNYSKLDKTNFN